MGKNSMKASIAWESFELNIDKKNKEIHIQSNDKTFTCKLYLLSL